jgi:coenzyme PQQ synthesis protein D (PqqD)
LNEPALALRELCDGQPAPEEMLDEPTELDGLCEELGDIYGIDPRSIEADVRALLADLVERGAIERAS